MVEEGKNPFMAATPNFAEVYNAIQNINASITK
jgi:hypothetical protein